MARILIFIPKGETEPITVFVYHRPNLTGKGIWNVKTNHVFLPTNIWNSWPANDQLRLRKIFDGLLKVSDDLTFK